MPPESSISPERWRQVETLFHQASGLAASARLAFLDRACAGDTPLRNEVESLLRNEPGAMKFIEASALQVAARGIVSDEASQRVGERFGHYQTLSLLGEGGMGRVYLADDVTLHRHVALKILPIEFAASPDRLARFEQEALAASALNHPNIVTIHEIGQRGDERFIVTEYIEGKTLREVMTNARLDIKSTLNIATQVAEALTAAHAAWIIHRDIKPENIMVRSDGITKVLDFGIAKMNDEVRSDSEADDRAFDAIKTSPGMVLGTASYMSPEQARGEILDGRTDLFSFGVVLYEMTTGRRLVAGETHAAVIEKLLKNEEPALAAAGLEAAPKELESIIRKCLRRQREERYASAHALLVDLQRLKGRFESRGQRRFVTISALVAGLAVLAVILAAVASVTEVWDERVLRDGHAAAVRRVAFSPDGTHLVSGSEDGNVIVWDFRNRSPVRVLSDHNDWVTCLSYSPDGKYFVSGSRDRKLIVWNALTLEIAKLLDEARKPVNAVGFSRDGRLMAAAFEGDQTLVWNTENWQKVNDLQMRVGEGGNFQFSPDGRRIHSRDITYDIISGEQSAPQLSGNWNWREVSPDATGVVDINGIGLVTFWKLRGGLAARTPVGQQRAHRDHGRAVAISPDGSFAATGAEDTVLWNVETRQLLARLEHQSIVWSLAFSPDGQSLVSSHGDGAILLWDVATRDRVANFNEHSQPVRSVRFSASGKRICSGSEDRSVIVWNADSGRKEAVLTDDGHGTRVTGVAFSSDEKSIASCDQDGMLTFWDSEHRKPRWTWKRRPRSPASYCVDVSRDGRFVATSLGIIDSNGREIAQLERDLGIGGVYGLAFSNDGRMLVTVSDGGDIKVIETDHWQLREDLKVPNAPFSSVSFLPSSRQFVTGEDGKLIRLWDVAPLREAGVIGKHDSRVKSVAVSPDGRRVVSAGDDKTIRLWDIQGRRLIAKIGTHTSPVLSVAFSPDGKQIVAGEHDRAVRLYTRHREIWGYPWD